MQKHRLALGFILGSVLSLLLIGGLFLGVSTLSAQGPSTTPTPAAPAIAPKAKAARVNLLTKFTITAMNGTTLTVSNGKNSRTVNTDSHTKFMRAGQAISLGDLKVGDQVRVRGQNVNGAITARAVNVVQPAVGGKVTGINGGNITVERNYLSATIVTNASTQFKRGQQTISLSDIKVGDAIAAQGTPNADGTFTATRVVEQTPRVAGQVKAINGSTLTIQRGYLSGKVITNSSTTITRGGKTIQLSDITVGSMVVVDGTPNSDGTFTATAIRVAAGKAKTANP